MTERFDIKNAPRSALSEIKEMCRATAAAHRIYQPAYFSENTFEASYESWVEDAYQDQTGKPLDHSPVIFAAYDAAELAGYIRLKPSRGQDADNSASVAIVDIAVKPAFQRQGVAGLLIEHVKSLADDRNWLTLDACIWQGNDASLATFEDHGFILASQTLRYGPDRAAPDIKRPTPTKRPFRISQAQLAWGVLAVLLLYLLLTRAI